MRRQAPTSLFIAAATIGEIQTGIERARVGNPIKADEIESWLESFVHEDRILPATAPIFRLWAKLMHGRTGDLSMDAMIAALQVLAVLVQSGKPMSALARQFEPVPQKLENVRFAKGGKPLENEKVKAAIAEAEARLNGSGRVLVRASGTEPLIRVMAEGDDKALVDQLVKDIAGAVKAAA